MSSFFTCVVCGREVAWEKKAEHKHFLITKVVKYNIDYVQGLASTFGALSAAFNAGYAESKRTARMQSEKEKMMMMKNKEQWEWREEDPTVKKKNGFKFLGGAAAVVLGAAVVKKMFIKRGGGGGGGDGHNREI